MTYLDLNPVRAGMVASPLDHNWSGHRALRREDGTELDFHPSYLNLGSESASRYEQYMSLLREDATRPALSLANEHFVGTNRFVKQMVERFGLDRGKPLRYKQLGNGVVCVGQGRGGTRHRMG
jgi:putative transposase